MKPLLTVVFLCLVAGARAETAMEHAEGLYQGGHYPEAEAAFHQIVRAEPQNATALYFLGRVIERRGDEATMSEAASFLEKAVTLSPSDPDYVYGYATACFHLADMKHSLVFALRGRDGMKRTIELNPNHLDARFDLMEFYARAPWPLGGGHRALEQAEGIARIDPVRGLEADLKLTEIFEKSHARTDARAACQAALKLSPNNTVAAASLARLALAD